MIDDNDWWQCLMIMLHDNDNDLWQWLIAMLDDNASSQWFMPR